MCNTHIVYRWTQLVIKTNKKEEEKFKTKSKDLSSHTFRSLGRLGKFIHFFVSYLNVCIHFSGC